MCVTLEGDILRTSGAITGGSTEKGRASAGTLSRTREIPELEKSVSENKMLFAAMTKNIEDYRVSIKGIEIEREALLKDVRSLEIEFSQWTAKCTAMKDKPVSYTHLTLPTIA